MHISALLIGVGLAAWTPAVHAQTGPREAVASSLTPDAAAAIFSETVMTGCVAAVAGGGRLVNAMGAGVSANAEVETRRQSGAAEDETVYDVVAGKGVVTAHDKAGRCVVSVYGPPAAPTIMALAQRLTEADAGFERLAAAASPTGLGAALFRVDGARRLQVMISGSEPGMPGHKSRFSVVRASVFSMPSN